MKRSSQLVGVLSLRERQEKDSGGWGEREGGFRCMVGGLVGAWGNLVALGLLSSVELGVKKTSAGVSSRVY